MNRLACCCLLLLAAGAAHGRWLPPDDHVPAARLIENLERQLAEKPADAHLLARLGRLHSLRYALGERDMAVQRVGESGALKYYEHGHGYPSTRHSVEGEAIAERIVDLHRALDYYRRAAAADPDEAYIWLGLGYVSDEMSHAAPYLAWPGKDGDGAPPMRDVVRMAWEEKALDAYSRALGVAPKLTEGFLTPPVELEAARYIIAILEPRDRLSRPRKALLTKAQGLAAQTARLPRMVTPIIFSLEAGRPFESLLAPNLAVAFDLDGTAGGHRWPWVHPDTALLVWDPSGRGEIASGRQLIGSVTWWLFWEHGYEALQALDDDGDGWLRGAELEGLAAWQDRNGNGISDPGEVRPLAALGIRALATAVTGRIDAMPMNHRGIELSGGQFLPTYDWIVSPVE